jgi:hypothetical protein
MWRRNSFNVSVLGCFWATDAAAGGDVLEDVAGAAL